MRIETKEQRLKIREAKFANHLEHGFTRETYKGLEIFRQEKDGKFYLHVYAGTSTNDLNKYYYKTSERMEENIKAFKASYDRREAYKEELKKNPTKSSAANCAAAIRKELKENFPSLKFSVTSENYAGGDSVRVSYVLGVDSKAVEELTDKYQYGHFNGMEDIYEYSNRREDIPQTKYLFVSQDIPENLRYRCAKMMSDKYNFTDVPKLENFEGFRTYFPERWGSAWSWEQMIYQDFKDTNFNTQDESNINLISCDYDPNNSGKVFFIYEVDGVEYDTREYKKEATKEAVKIAPVEVKTGEVQIIEYGKGLAVIGDTKPIKDTLKGLGGFFNFRLSCGAGWIFPKAKLQELQEALSEPDTLKTEIQKTVDFFKETDLQLFGEVTEQTKRIEAIQS